MHRLCARLAVLVWLLSQADLSRGQPEPVPNTRQRVSASPKPRYGAGRVLRADTLQYRRSATSLIGRFATDGSTYETAYTRQEAATRQKRCQPALKARQAIVDQFALIDRFLSQSAVDSLVDARQNDRLPIIDSLRISRGRVAYLGIRYTVPFAPACTISPIDTSEYRALRVLGQQNRLRIMIYQMTAMVVSALPALTGNTQTDAKSYLNTIRRLLSINQQRLQTTFNEYIAYEGKRRLATDKAVLTFRREFCYCILCDLESN